jgi:hypothetical protein
MNAPAKLVKFACPICQSRICVRFSEFWKCHNGHKTPIVNEQPPPPKKTPRATRLPYTD